MVRKERVWLGHHQEISRTGLTGKRRERWKKASGGWSLKRKRKCRISLSCRMPVDHVEEMSLESPRKRQDVQGVMSEFAGKGNERKEEKMRGGWNQNGKRRRWKPKWFRTGWKASTWTLVVKVRGQSEAPGEEGEEIKSPKRKIIRVESEDTQDYVREANDVDQVDQEEGEEISFVPSTKAVVSL